MPEIQKVIPEIIMSEKCDGLNTTNTFFWHTFPNIIFQHPVALK
jgi:hypothetical protein